MRRILTVIPARGGSKGVPGKNIRTLNGKPLISYAIEKAISSAYVEQFIVSTDDNHIAEISMKFGGLIPFMRPLDLGLDHIPLLAVMKHALDYYDEEGEHFDAVLSLQVTTPLLTSESVDRGIRLFHETNAACVVTVSEINHGHPLLAKRMVGGVLEDFLPIPHDVPRYPRQKREPAFYASGGMFLRDRSLIEAMDIRSNGFGANPLGVVVDPEESINIDSPLDFDLAEFFIARNKKGHSPEAPASLGFPGTRRPVVLEERLCI